MTEARSPAKVAILMGSDSDWSVMEAAAEALGALDIPFDVQVTSAHRTPERTVAYVRAAVEQGVEVFVVGAGAAAHLAGTVAAHTTRPVIAVPIAATKLNGLDALLASVQMPSGIPVATVAVDGARNGGLLAAQILATHDAPLARRLTSQREEMARKVAAKNDALRAKIFD